MLSRVSISVAVLLLVVQSAAAPVTAVERSAGAGTTIDSSTVPFAQSPDRRENTTGRAEGQNDVSSAPSPPTRRWAATGDAGGYRTTAVADTERTYYIETIAARPVAEAVDESSVDVAILDTGVDTDHPDLDGTLAWGVNTYVLGDPLYGLEHVEDVDGHGTGMAGILGAEADGSGIVGVAPQVDIYVMKIANDGKRMSRSAAAEAVKIALRGPDGRRGTEDDVDVISMSFGSEFKGTFLQSVIRNESDEVVFVAAARNSGDGDPTTEEVEYPAKYPGVIAVGGTNGEGQPSPQASEGAPVDIAAPTHDTRQTYLNGSYATAPYGTSAATPQVAGAVALLIAKYGEMGTAEARRLLTGNATDIRPPGTDNFTGAGRLNVSRTLGVSALDDGSDDDGGGGGSDDGKTVTVTDVERLGSTDLVAGDAVTIAVTVEAPEPTFRRTYNFTVAVNGSPQATVSGVFSEPRSRTHYVTLPVLTPGPVNLTVGGEESTVIEVAPNPTAVSIDAPNETLAGAPTRINVSVTNTGTDTYERTVTVRTGGDRIGQPTVTVDPSETVTTTVSTRFDDLGNHTVGVINRTGEVRTDTLRVTPAVSITDVSAPDLDRPGELEAEVTLDNVGPADRTIRLRASINNSTVATTTIRPTVDANSTDTAFLRLDLPANGTYELAIDRPSVANDTVTRIVQVGPTDDSPGDGNQTPTGAVPSVTVDAGPGAVVNGTATLTLSVTNVGDRPADLARLRLADLPEVLDVRHVRTAGATLNGTDGRFGVGDRVVFDDPLGAPDIGPPAVGDTRRATVVLDVPDTVPAGLTLSVTVAASVNDSVRTDSATVALPTLDPDSPARFDRDGDDRIEPAEVLDAVAAYRDGDSVAGHPVTARDVLAVLAAFGTDRGRASELSHEPLHELPDR